MKAYSSCNPNRMLLVVIFLQCLLLVTASSSSAFTSVGCNHHQRFACCRSRQLKVSLSSSLPAGHKISCPCQEETVKSNCLYNKSLLYRPVNIGIIPNTDVSSHVQRNNHYHNVSKNYYQSSCQIIHQQWAMFKQTITKFQRILVSSLTKKIFLVNHYKHIPRLMRVAPIFVAMLCLFSFVICPFAFAAESSSATAAVAASATTTAAAATASGRSRLQAATLESAESAFRILYAAVLGSVLGFERSSSSQKAGAGVRTMALVSLGACVFGMCGTHGFAARFADEVARFYPPTTVLVTEAVDASRMASSVATGVGFLGAGIISNNRRPDGTYDKESSVRGLTTAAAIWVSSAIGVSAGAGLYSFAFIMAFVTVVTLRMGEYMNSPDPPRSSPTGKMPGTKNLKEDAPPAGTTSTKSIEEKWRRVSDDAEGVVNTEFSTFSDASDRIVPVDGAAVTTSSSSSSVAAVKPKTAAKAVDPLLERVILKREGALPSQVNVDEIQESNDEKQHGVSSAQSLEVDSSGNTYVQLSAAATTKSKAATKAVDPLLERVILKREGALPSQIKTGEIQAVNDAEMQDVTSTISSEVSFLGDEDVQKNQTLQENTEETLLKKNDEESQTTRLEDDEE